MVCGLSDMTKTELTVPLNVLKIKKPWISKLKAAGATHVRRRRLAPPMYDGRWTTEADGVCLCTIFDVRCTIWIIARFARGQQSRSERDVIKPCADGGGWRRPCTTYDVRCTIWKVSARCAFLCIYLVAAAEGCDEARQGHANLLTSGDDVEASVQPRALCCRYVQVVGIAAVVETQGEFGSLFAGAGGLLMLRELVGEARVVTPPPRQRRPIPSCGKPAHSPSLQCGPTLHSSAAARG